MPDPQPSKGDSHDPSPLSRPAFRVIVLLVWLSVLAAFWLAARIADAGIIDFVLRSIDRALTSPWAPLGLLALYTVRPLLLVPITVVNLASGFFLGVAAGIALGMVGTLLSATVGYAIGRIVGSAEMADRMSSRWAFVRMLRNRSFESIVAGGLMYLHADMVNVPSGLLRIRFPVFLLGIALGNALLLATAVLTGAAVEGNLAEARVTIEPWYLAAAAVLLVVSLGLAYWLRRRVRPLTS